MFSLLAKDEALIFNISGIQKEIESKVFFMNEPLNEENLLNKDENISVVMSLQEGYIVIRVWPDNKYCALNIIHWSNLTDHKILKKE